MATKKASSSKAAAKKRPTTKKPATVVTKDTTVAAKTGGKKLTVGEKFALLRPGALVAEFFGTFVLAAAVIKLTGGSAAGSIAIALILAVLVIVFGVVSGAHLNPAITIAQYVNRKVDGVKTVAYICAQVLGAVAAFGLLLGMFNATTSLEAQVYDALTGNGYVKAEDIANGGGVEKYLKETYQMTIDDAAKQLNVTVPTFVDHKMTADKEWVDLLLELVGAIIFGLGVGYAVCAEKKNQIEAGLAVGVSLLAGLVVGGATVILNPAVAAAIGGLDAANPFGAEAMTFWWPVFTYIGMTTIGITAGFTIYRVILKDVLSK
jgi:glycerol uptake facilitator-like aquaporin